MPVNEDEIDWAIAELRDKYKVPKDEGFDSIPMTNQWPPAPTVF